MRYLLGAVLPVGFLLLLGAALAIDTSTVEFHSPASYKDYKTPGLPLQYPTEHRSHNGVLHMNMELDEFHYDGPYSMMVRALNGEIPGPTIRAKRGDTVHVHWCNKLDGRIPGNTGHNLFGDPNITNMHTHGLHISPNEPSDNVFVKIQPGACYDYTYEIPM